MFRLTFTKMVYSARNKRKTTTHTNRVLANEAAGGYERFTIVSIGGIFSCIFT